MIRRRDGTTVYSGPHVGSRGSIRNIYETGADDFSEGIPDEDVAWETAARSAMLTREASFGQRWSGDWESWDEDDNATELTQLLWGLVPKRQELPEPPFGRR